MRLRTSTCEIPRFNRVFEKFLAANTFFSRSPHRFKHMCAEVIFKKLALFESFKAVFQPRKSFASCIEALQRSRLGWKGTANFLAVIEFHYSVTWVMQGMFLWTPSLQSLRRSKI